MMKGRFLTIGACLLALSLVTACAKQEKKQQTFVMVPKLVHPYYEPCYEGFKDACTEHGILCEFEAPAKGDLAL